MELTSSQKRATEELFLRYQRQEKLVDFRAPTGAGKTFIISNLIAKILRGQKNLQKTVVVLATLSSSQLPEQFAAKVQHKYMPYLPWSYNIEYKAAPSTKKSRAKDYQASLIAKDQTMIIVGKASFTKASIFVEQGVFAQFLDQIRNENWNLIYIRDEAHHGGRPSRGKINHFENQIQEAATFIVRMTATPKDFTNFVEITERELARDGMQLLKNHQERNYKLEEIHAARMTNWELLEHVLKTFKNDIQKKYQSLNLIENQETINPALLIQVNSKSVQKNPDFEADIEQIIKTVRKYNLNYVKYFGDEKTSNIREKIDLLEISRNNSAVDVIIFKVGPATGWDIPRACVLLQLRNISSLDLNIQTIGRIKRNPLSKLTLNPITDRYYYYTNHQKFKMPEEYHYRLYQKHVNESWMQGKTPNFQYQKKLFADEYQKKTQDLLENRKNDIIDYTNRKRTENKPLIYKEDTYRTKYDQKYIRTRQHELKNQLELIRYIKQQQRKHVDLLGPIQQVIYDLAQKWKIASSWIYWWLLRRNWISFKREVYDVCIENNLSFRQYQLIAKKKLIQDYVLRQENKMTFFPLPKKHYLYDTIAKSGIKQQALDSTIESIYMGKVEALFDRATNDQETWIENVLWSKNPITSEIYLEDVVQNRIYKIYPDFIYKIHDYYVYVEVKGDEEKDIKLEKTNQIRKIFKNYTTKAIKMDKVVFSLVRIWNRYSEPQYENFSTIPEIQTSYSLGKVLAILHKLAFDDETTS